MGRLGINCYDYPGDETPAKRVLFKGDITVELKAACYYRLPTSVVAFRLMGIV
jgi:hypothetical protein